MRVIWRRITRRPAEAIAAAMALATCLYVVIAPFVAGRYPMMTDLPFHAANASIIRHHGEVSWHFQEQFELQPFAVPYLSLYLIAAAAMTFTSPLSAIQIAAVVMLLLLPAGLAVLFWGMRKSPLLGVVGAGLCWGGLTHWGFLNFLGALGLFAMALGVALRQLDRPSWRRGVLLTVLLLLVFFTHPFRFPFAMAAVAAAALLLSPATRRVTPVTGPMIPPALLFAAWWGRRPEQLAADLGRLEIHGERLAEIPRFLYRGLVDPAEAALSERALTILLASAGVLVIASLRRARQRRRPAWAFQLGAHATVLGCAGVFLLLYLMLPMQIGLWWYVFPREITSALFVALALLPDLPRAGWWKISFVSLAALALFPLGSLVADHYARFDRQTQDFAAISESIPAAPKLLYLIVDHHGATAIHSPFLHLPAYVQAEKGGWLSFHFATWGASPVVYRPRREPGAVVPPPVPLRWEWTPERFEVARHGAFFDWFLVRSRRSPAWRFAADPSLSLVERRGDWWLLRRAAAQSPRR